MTLTAPGQPEHAPSTDVDVEPRRTPPGPHRTAAERGAPSGRDGGDMPSSVTGHPGLFDRFATVATEFVSRAPFFAFCVLLVVVWAPTFFLFGNVDTWQLIINTMTTIVTFLLIALLQNAQYRSDEATQHKLNAIADGLSDLMRSAAQSDEALRRDMEELRRAVGLEDRETST